MRIDALELRAYGPFTGLRLDLSQGAHGLHVIHGPNEAGKSSALRALAAALFGIGGQTTDNFVHDYPELRLAMTLRNANGERLSCVRRKANKHALRDAADADPLAEDALRAFLGRVDQEEFERVFGLDHIRLRDGSERMLAASEGADAAIVGATLGVNDLRQVRVALETEAKELFTQRASKPRINAAIAEWKRLQTELRQRELGRSAWHEAREEAERLGRLRDEVTTRENQLRRDHRDLEFVLRNRPRMAGLDDLRRRLAALASVPDLAVEFEERRREAEASLHKAQVLRDQQREELVARKSELSQLPAEFGILAHVAEVEELRTLASQVQKATSDRERRRGEALAAVQERDRLAKELGVATPLERASIDELKLCLAARERCDELVQEFTRLSAKRAELLQHLADLELQREACDRRCAEAKPAMDPAVLKQSVRAVNQLGDIDGKLAALQADLAEAGHALAEGLQCLPGFEGDVEDLAKAQLPGPVAIEDFGRRYGELEDEERRSRKELSDLLQRRDRAAAEAAHIAAGGAVPTEQDLGASRDRRQAQWRLVRRAWMEGVDVTVDARAIDPDRTLADAFAHSTERSDVLADQMRRESDRVAQLDEKRRQHEGLERELATNSAMATARQQLRERLDGEWRAVWAGSGLLVGSVAAMKDALSARQRLLEQAAARRELVASVADLRHRRSEARAALADALAATGFAGVTADADVPLAPALQRAEARLEELERNAAARQRDAEEQQRLHQEIAKANKKIAGIDEQLAAWRQAFAAATQGMPGRDSAAPDTVPRVLQRIAAIQEQADKVDGIEERIRKIDADAAQLAVLAREFRRTHLPQLAEEEPVAFVARLAKLVEVRKEEKVRFDTLSRSVEKLGAGLRRVELEHKTAIETLLALAHQAGVTSIDDLPKVVQQADEKRRRREELARIETELRGEGFPLEEIERRVRALEGRDIEAELGPLARDIDIAQRDGGLRRDEASRASLRVEELERQTGAAETAAAMAGIAAQVREDVERYVRLACASRLLGVAVERFRARHEIPLLRQASHYFVGLTRGRYDHIETDVDDEGRPFFLVRETASKSAKPLSALSDGTRDQLHLALVLGSLAHRFAAGGESMPLILDDVLVHFDDERSLAALQVLAEFAALTQVILFTHHGRIREQAASLVATGKVFVHELLR